MPITHDLELPIAYVPITGPGVETYERRKECGSPVEITEAQLRASYEKVKDQVIAGITMLLNAPIRTR